MGQMRNMRKKKSTQRIFYKAAKVILPVMMDEYTKERERGGIIDNKAITLLTILVALLTIYIPIVPFENIIRVYNEGTQNALICLGVTGLLFVSAIIITVIAFVKLIRIIQLHNYERVAVQDIATPDALKVLPDEAEKALCVHYFNLIETNADINDKKANRISDCFVLTIVSFLLLLCSILILSTI